VVAGETGSLYGYRSFLSLTSSLIDLVFCYHIVASFGEQGKRFGVKLPFLAVQCYQVLPAHADDDWTNHQISAAHTVENLRNNYVREPLHNARDFLAAGAGKSKA
jgi:hypothetical protein